ncbi:unnamed protein product [Cuscuta epithymum]|uniref:Uncharacterized protein n=1 Tax=Cuscuta epithymum TaxID=186058 RepID=A0AAV0CP00_9ASTE|nr:unnamed protein product [Cuscuta epithymum]
MTSSPFLIFISGLSTASRLPRSSPSSISPLSYNVLYHFHGLLEVYIHLIQSEILKNIIFSPWMTITTSRFLLLLQVYKFT